MTISAKIIADSISEQGIRMTTMEWEYPRIIHSEVMTHRRLSKNAASSRAIPVKKAVELVQSDMVYPHYFGRNQAGMQAAGPLNDEEVDTARAIIDRFRVAAVRCSSELNDLGLHKQNAGRYIESVQNIKIVVSGTEWENFFWLRHHEAAQPELQALAKLARSAMDNSIPNILKPGEWHLPYVTQDDFVNLDLDERLILSSSLCAQVSYRKSDDSLEKAKDIFKRLVESDRVHASPFEHQATPIDVAVHLERSSDWDAGITHIDRDEDYWSGNLRGWIQHRQLIPNHDKRG